MNFSYFIRMYYTIPYSLLSLRLYLFNSFPFFSVVYVSVFFSLSSVKLVVCVIFNVPLRGMIQEKLNVFNKCGNQGIKSKTRIISMKYVCVYVRFYQVLLWPLLQLLALFLCGLTMMMSLRAQINFKTYCHIYSYE